MGKWNSCSYFYKHTHKQTQKHAPDRQADDGLGAAVHGCIHSRDTAGLSRGQGLGHQLNHGGREKQEREGRERGRERDKNAVVMNEFADSQKV